jgi:hypothetical protein
VAYGTRGAKATRPGADARPDWQPGPPGDRAGRAAVMCWPAGWWIRWPATWPRWPCMPRAPVLRAGCLRCRRKSAGWSTAASACWRRCGPGWQRNFRGCAAPGQPRSGHCAWATRLLIDLNTSGQRLIALAGSIYFNRVRLAVVIELARVGLPEAFDLAVPVIERGVNFIEVIEGRRVLEGVVWDVDQDFAYVVHFTLVVAVSADRHRPSSTPAASEPGSTLTDAEETARRQDGIAELAGGRIDDEVFDLTQVFIVGVDHVDARKIFGQQDVSKLGSGIFTRYGDGQTFCRPVGL